MKTFLIFAIVAATSAFAQTPQTTSDSFTNRFGSGSFTNNSSNYSVEQLAEQLRNLRTTVDETLPVVTAFSPSSSVLTNEHSVKSTISGLLAGALNRNTNATSSDSSQGKTNMVGRLAALLQPGAGSTSGTTPNTWRDLETLQNQLQAISTTLGSLGLGATNTFAPNSGLTPTGR
jgi:hypothetical protein